MGIIFNKILVPVDFTVNSKMAVQKALTFCERPGAAIHLLHVPKMLGANIVSFYQYFANYSFDGKSMDMKMITKQFDELKTFILTTRNDVEVFTWFAVGNKVQAAIEKKAKKIGADLIIIAKNSHHSWLPFLNTVVPSRIAKKTGIMVLTVKQGATDQDIKTVVVPIGQQFPINKVAVINMLRKKFRIQIRLVAFLPDKQEPVVLPTALLNAYRILKNNPANNVTYDILHGDNKVKAIVRYCRKVNADLVIVYPESETRIGWLNKHISDVLPVQSKTQILAINPIN